MTVVFDRPKSLQDMKPYYPVVCTVFHRLAAECV